MGFLFFVVLLILLAGFFLIDPQGVFTMQVGDANINTLLASYGFDVAQLRGLLAIAILFCEFAVILFAMLDQIGDTIRETIKPLLRIIPLSAFLVSAYQTFEPVFGSLLRLDSTVGISTATATQQVNTSVVWTLFLMVVFLVINYVLGRARVNPELKALRAENARLKKELLR